MYNLTVNSDAVPAQHQRHQSQVRARQQGSTLIEMLVGIAVGLLVVTAAFGTLVLSRTTSLAVNDQLELQQQANMAMRIMSNMLRQTNTRVAVQPAPTGNIGLALLSAPPAFTGSALYLTPQPRDAADNDDFGIAFTDDGGTNATQDCLGNRNPAVGNPSVIPAGGTVTSRFSVNTNRLVCLGTQAATGAQPLINDVQRLRVLYGAQTGTGATATTQYYTQAQLAAVVPAPSIIAVEICLELATAARGGTPSVGGQYTDCDGVQVNNDQRVRVIARQAVRLRAVPIL